MQNIISLGAYDRFNYGDLLFPIIFNNILGTKSSDIQIFIHALLSSDLSKYGAKETGSIRDLYRSKYLKKDDVVVFTGGGTIGVDWLGMHENLLGSFGNAALYYMQRLFGRSRVNSLSRIYLGGRSDFPWVASPGDFPVPVKIAYNAVGGSEISNLPIEIQKKTLRKLSDATYLSVRDNRTKQLLSAIENETKVYLAPDSAILMSEQYPLSDLDSMITANVRDITQKEEYICFQANIGYAREFNAEIVKSLEKIYFDFGLTAILLPIGRYVGLEDHSALQKIANEMRTPVSVISDHASIWEIMYVIAMSRFFIGTSLHGNITSQSFAIPHLGLSEHRCKVDYYLETWDIPTQSKCVSLKNLNNNFAEALAVPVEVRKKKRKELIELSKLNFDRLIRVTGINNMMN